MSYRVRAVSQCCKFPHSYEICPRTPFVAFSRSDDNANFKDDGARTNQFWSLVLKPCCLPIIFCGHKNPTIICQSKYERLSHLNQLIKQRQIKPLNPIDRGMVLPQVLELYSNTSEGTPLGHNFDILVSKLSYRSNSIPKVQTVPRQETGVKKGFSYDSVNLLIKWTFFFSCCTIQYW
jgi:hypothetical protein